MNGVESFVKKTFQLFDEDDIQLHVSTQQEHTKFEKSLCDGRITDMFTFLKNSGMQHPLVSAGMVEAVCQFLLYAVSAHTDQEVVNAASDSLVYLLQTGVSWSPGRPQLLAIALNLGMKEEFLPTDFQQSELPRWPRDRGAEERGRAREEFAHPFRVEQTLLCLSESLRSCPAAWAGAALDALFLVLVAVLSDRQLTEALATHPATVCSDCLVNAYPRESWSEKVLDLAERLGEVPPAAQLLVLSGLPRQGRGDTLRRVTAYYYLQLTHCASQLDLPSDVKVADVLEAVRTPLLPEGQRLQAADLESMFTALSCADIAVGSSRPPSGQRRHLVQLQKVLQAAVDRVRDDIDDLHELRIRVKELMVALAFKWGHMTQRKLIQTTLDSYSQG